MGFIFRDAVQADVDALLLLENRCFESDRLTARSFHWMISRANACLIVAEQAGQLAGYALVLFHRGTSLGRLYSLAIAEVARGKGLGRQLLQRAEEQAVQRDCAYLRLEVRPDNLTAIGLYEHSGYRRFAQVDDYYQDHAPALRYEKRIVEHARPDSRSVPYYQQTLEFTCGPACLLMALKALQPARSMERAEELQIWREATTVFMTSGHGGCSPHGLALAAWRRGFAVELQVSMPGPLFLGGVRSEAKKQVIRLVHEQFCRELEAAQVQIRPNRSLDLQSLLDKGGRPLVLISSYRLTRSKAPHWVMVTDCDRDFVYLHDPDIDHSLHRQAIDCQHLPVSHADFNRMSCFGADKLRAAVIVFAGAAS
ncbi:GNAT family N-acetyltransferase/peptidase C39 family protein [Pseudomonas sp. CDFA 602]|uniref:GNAT family N-acetyltransferase/peptidase C39 family protein n=1 Tax=Pseudomonas californiensis TaxID=2829823 RepID=UPI001E5F154B|nr:GNAT family N-acetyltransferase/peptidase C39 family protein [Pseudomonas californiensis]MCD5995781.1 GNAT family N-acetyltransferase/peptidase C39 family protein [Pseudomonas californiensis]MCD6001366.1 GNAT family N-acetyltransferase/peptidase C39 family protein [Pseudomonas californiensis]